MSIKIKLRVLLAEAEMTQTKLSELSKVRPTTLSFLATGKAREIRFDTLNKLCKTLNCQPGDLLKYIPDDEEP